MSLPKYFSYFVLYMYNIKARIYNDPFDTSTLQQDINPNDFAINAMFAE